MHLFLLNIKQAIRNLLKHKWQTILSVFGMVMGLVCFSFSINWIWNETHRDSFRRGSDEVYAVQKRFYDDSLKYTQKEASGFGYYISAPDYTELKKNLPKEADLSLIVDIYAELTDEEGKIIDIGEGGFLGVDKDFARMFDLRSVAGDARQALSVPGQIVMTRSKAIALYGSEKNALGKRIHKGNSYKFPGERTFQVSAIIEDNRPMTNFKMEMLTLNENAIAPGDINNWSNHNYYAWVRTADMEATERAFSAIQKPDTKRWERGIGLVPLKYYHLQNDCPASQIWKRLIYPLAFAGVSLLLLLSALFNYIAILTSLFLGRQREYSLRISMGGTFSRNASWLRTEVGITLLLVLILSGVVLEWVSMLSRMPEATLNVYGTFIICALFFIIVVLLGAYYPAYRLKRSYRKRFSGMPVERHVNQSLLFLQLTVCFLLIFIEINAYRQLHSIFTADLGFSTENILRIGSNQQGLNGRVYRKHFYDIEERLNNGSNPAIVKAMSMQSDMFESMGRSSRSGDMFGIQEEPYSDNGVRILTLPYEAKDFFSLKLQEGEWFSLPVNLTEEQPILVNPEAIEVLNLHDYKNLKLHWESTPYWNQETKSWTSKTVPAPVKGVVSFRTHTMHTVQEPLVIFCSPDGRTNHMSQWNQNAIYIKHKPGMEKEAREEINKVFREFQGEETGPEIERMSDRILSFYEAEKNYLNIFTIMTAGSILITFLGVLSMILYTLRVQRRSVAIRRVFGATYKDLNKYYLKGYLIYTFLGSLIAYPIGMYIMRKWLEGYSLKVSVGWMQGVGVFILMLALVTVVVMSQIARIMREDPADVVKSE